MSSDGVGPAGTRTRIRVGVDTGGTFTDLIAIADDGRMFRAKTLSTPDNFAQGILDALDHVLKSQRLSGADIEGLVHGTTVATNALLEGSGQPVGLLTTLGFRDVLEIGRGQWDGDIYDLAWVKPPPLVARQHRLEIDERISAAGEIVRPLDEEQVRTALAAFERMGIQTVAVCLLNSYANSAHEMRIKTIAAEEFPALSICISTEVMGDIREFERTSTAVINAYLKPVVHAYLVRLQKTLAAIGYRKPVKVMQSNGGVVSADVARELPVNIVESGPAAGVLACCYLAKQIGIQNLIAFDMGGTTAKASLVENGKPFIASEYHVGGDMNFSGGHREGHVIRVPSIEIAEVGAGGGSIAWLDPGGALRVGPRSAGASPGPACYNLGGTEPTVTDAFAVLGYLDPHAIAGGAKTIDLQRAEEAIRTHIAEPSGLSLEDAAWGIYCVATSTMIRAVRAVTVERGRDARDFTLVAFGGAGPLHAAELARAMGLPQVVIPNSPGLFSALGLLMADVERTYSRTAVYMIANLKDADVARCNVIFRDLEATANANLEAEGFTPDRIVIERTASLQYLGQSYELIIPLPSNALDRDDLQRLARDFSNEHLRTYGYQEDPARVQLMNLRIVARGVTQKSSYAEIGRQSIWQATRSTLGRRRRVYFGPQSGWHEAGIVRRSDLKDNSLVGPAIVEEFDTTIVVPPYCIAELSGFGDVTLTLPDTGEGTAEVSEAAPVNAMTLELVKNSLSTITDEMAVTLARTARSLIMKDSHDFSVALCTPQGDLVTSGVGIALHLGAIPSAMTCVLETFGDDFAEGDLVFMNDPYAGGMHLPDIFVFKPIFLEGELLGFAATTAHMADVGGRVPGGNAADSTEIYQEGLRIPPMKLAIRGEIDQRWLSLIRANVRQPDTVLGDLFAEIAACNTAEGELRSLAGRYGSASLKRYMTELIAYGERMSRAALEHFQPGRYTFTDYLDDDGMGGEPVRIVVAIDVNKGGIAVDFAGTSPQVRSAINAPLSIAKSVVAFIVKAMIGGEIPNNAGFLKLLKVDAPAGTVANMSFPAACAARAVTAYRMTDALLGALAPVMPDRVPAAGDGGPAVFSVGGEDRDGKPFVFMELISGSFGGRPSADGLEGVAAPIVNAKNTSCELIEANYPIRVEHYGFVADTGGAGRHRGGLAIQRDLRFLGRRAILQIRSDRSRVAPWGLAGGMSGTMSENVLISRDGTARRLPSKIVTEIVEGDLWRHVTAGAGGWGDPADRQHDAIERDIREDKLTAEAAKRHYGFAVQKTEPERPQHAAAKVTPADRVTAE